MKLFRFLVSYNLSFLSENKLQCVTTLLMEVQRKSGNNIFCCSKQWASKLCIAKGHNSYCGLVCRPHLEK